jgi:hypothetical protein
MTSSMSDIRAGLVANLRSAYPDGVQVGKYILSSPNPPTLQLRSGAVNYDLAMGGGLDDFTLIIQGVAQLNEVGQMQIDTWAARVGGVKSAAELDKKLGGAVNDLRVTGMAEPVAATVGGMDVLLAEWSVSVYPGVN